HGSRFPLLATCLTPIQLRTPWHSDPEWMGNSCIATQALVAQRFQPGTEWLRFTRRKLPKEEGVYTSLMDERSMSPLLALPGRENIGLGRHWHGIGVMLWVVNGLFYVIMLFATGLWTRLVPTSWDVFPEEI